MTCQKFAKQEAAAWMAAAKGLEETYHDVFIRAEDELLREGKVQLSYVDAHHVSLTYKDRCLTPEGRMAVHDAGYTAAVYEMHIDRLAMSAMTSQIAVSCNYRLSQQVISFDPTITALFDADHGSRQLLLSDSGEPLPTDLLMRLPFETFVVVPNGGPVRSYLVHCVQGWTHGPGQMFLNVVARMDTEDGSVRQVPVATMLERGHSLLSAIDLTLEWFKQSDVSASDEIEEHHRYITAAILAQVMPYLLYLSAENRELDGDISSVPAITTTKKGKRLLARAAPNLMEAGVRVGAAIRAHQEARPQVNADGEPNGSTVVPHLRKAHWHTFWTGPRNEPANRRRILRFLPPIPVNVDRPSDLQAVVRPATSAV